MMTPAPNIRTQYEAFMVAAGFRFWERTTCSVCTGSVPVDKYKSKSDPYLSVWIFFTKARFEVWQRGRMKERLPINQLKARIKLL